ncbi:hypothetical protein CCP2SC5_380027 [Azospirillaceae bacterium]
MRTQFFFLSLRRRHLRRILTTGVVLTFGACALAPSELRPPNPDELTLEEFLNGDDLQAKCFPSHPDHFRLVFRSADDDRIVSYDIIADSAPPTLTDEETADFGERFGIFGEKPPQIGAEVVLRLLSPLPSSDQSLPPWRQNGERLRLSTTAFSTLIDRLSDSGAFLPPPEGLRFPVDGFRWLVSGCHAGAHVLAVRPHVTGYRVSIRHRTHGDSRPFAPPSNS